MNLHKIQHQCITKKWVGKIPKLVFVATLFLIYNTFGQTVNFSFNLDSAYAGKQITFTNNSTGFPSNIQFIWNNGECTLDSTILISNCNDTIVGYTSYTNVFWIPGFYVNTLTAYFNGIVYKYTDTLFVTPPRQLLSMSCDCNNIILNPGFENYNFCPNLNYPNGMQPAFAGGALSNWYQPPMIPPITTPDPNYILTNSCSPGAGINSPAWMPCNPFGFEQGFNLSNAYIGLVTYNSTGSYREYAEEQIQCALLAGVYEISMQVSLPENVKYANNNLATYLSIGSLPPSNTTFNLPYTPQFKHTPTITTRNGWTNVSGLITALGNEDHITIGNFNDNVTTNNVFVNNISTNGCTYQGYQNNSMNSGYYYIDEVILKPHIPQQITVTNSPCSSNATLTSAGGISYNYLWNTGALTQSIIVTLNGVYTVTVTHATGCTATATVQVTVNPGINVNVTSTPNCTSNGTAYSSVSGGIAPYSFLWSNGQVTNPAYGLANGVYTVTVTGSNGCSATGTVNVQSYGSVSINISKTDQCDATELGTIDASINSTGPCTFLWSTGVTSSSITQLVAGIYTVTVTNTNTGCTASESVTIENLSVYSPILVGTSFTSCGGEFPIEVTIDNYAPAYNYTWSVTPNNTNEPPTMIPGSNSSYVDIIVSNGYGCTVTVTTIIANCTYIINYYIQDCCEGTTLPDLMFVDANAADLISIFGTTSINNIFVNPITINGTLIIDDNVSFNNCKFIMGPASKIEVLPLYTLTINNCYFNACDKMWKGIEVDKNAYLNLTESQVEDAQYAIELKDQALAIIKHVELNNNFVGMYASPQNTLQTIYSTIADVQFQTNSTMVSAYLGQLPLLGTNCFAGIWFNDVSYLNVGSFNPGDECLFNTLSNGIIAANTNLNSTNNRFYDINPNNAYTNLTNLSFSNLKPLFFNGTAIVGIGTGLNYLNVVGNPLISGTTMAISEFFGNHRCIYFYGVDGNIQNNYMVDLPPSGNNTIGIELRQILDLQTVTILDNTINSSSYGIRAIDNYNSDIEIDNNNINIYGNNNGEGISCQNATTTTTGFNIHNNIINAINCKQGIILTNINKAQVVENMVDMSAAAIGQSNYFGINLVNSHINNINCNTVIGNGYNLSATNNTIASNAYRFNMSTNNEIACNSSDMTDVGFRFLNDCNNSDFRSNTIGQHWQGLRLNSAPVLSPQIDKGNMWTFLTSYSNNGAFWDTPTTFGQNTFNVDFGSTIPGNNVFYPTNNGITVQWFSQSGNVQDDCSNMACKAPVAHRLSNDSTITNNDLLVAADSLVVTEFVTQTTYELKKALNEKLNANPFLMNGSTLLTDFYTETEAGTIGQYNVVKAVLDSSAAAENALDSTIIVSRDSLINILHAVQVIDSVLALLCSSSDSTTLLLQKSNLLNYVTQHHAVNDSLSKLLYVMQQSKVTAASVLNDGVTANTEVFETNRNVVNRIFLSTIARKVFLFTITDMEDLIAVAVQCPFTGGKAVFEARAMVDYFNDTIVYDDDANCLAQGYTMKQYKPLIENSFVVKAIPNPATTLVTFTYTPDLFETGLLTITDNLSRKVVVRTINGKGTINVDLQGFNPGIYYYKITGAKYCETGKLIVF